MKKIAKNEAGEFLIRQENFCVWVKAGNMSNDISRIDLKTTKMNVTVPLSEATKLSLHDLHTIHCTFYVRIRFR